MRRVALISLLACCLLAPVPAAAAGDGFVKHQERYWSWSGPRSWFASSGAYGIAISDPKNTMGIDYGGSSTLCDGPPDQHFRNARNQIRNNPSLRRVKLRKSRFQQANGTFFNTFDFSAVGEKGKVKGEIKLAYSSYDGQYCYASGLTKVAPAQGFRDSIKLLRRVTSSIAYFGPGLPIDPGTGLP
jgi:hypothetical protein